jgi:hypothetical protein
VPVDFFHTVVSGFFPCRNFGLHGRDIANSAIQALFFQDAEF